MTRTLFAFGMVSFFTDVSSEMIYPLLPLFLTQTLGATPWALGFIEGCAEAIAALLKYFSGRVADGRSQKKPLILFGYGLSGGMRPLMGLATTWPIVWLIRFSDRVGKGIRTSPRDALLSQSVAPEFRGRAFGFHRAMDHAGALTGPVVATLLLTQFHLEMREVFLWAAVPSLIAFAAVVWGVSEKSESVLNKPPLRLSWADAKKLGRPFWTLFGAVILFTLGNSSDAFILLRLSEAGIESHWIPLLWAAHSGIKMISTAVGGNFSDHWGARKMILLGWGFFSLIYLGFAHFSHPSAVLAIFLLYGIYYGLVEPSERSLVAALTPRDLQGTAFGLFHFATGIALLPASLLFGGLWTAFGSAAAFAVGAFFSGIAAVLLWKLDYAD